MSETVDPTTDPNDPQFISPTNRPDLQFDRRPWGTFQVLDDQPGYKVKTLTVDPGQRLSYQRHHHRSEHWVIVAGTARVTLDGVVTEHPYGTVVEVPVEGAHRIENPGTEPMTFIEVQTGDYFGEDDIVRLEDDYGRG